MNITFIFKVFRVNLNMLIHIYSRKIATQLAKDLKTSFQSASTALNNLAKKGIVKERTGFGRNRIFATEEVISILARNFGEDPKVIDFARRQMKIS